MVAAPLVTVVVPSYNQGAYLNDALASIFDQDFAVEVFAGRLLLVWQNPRRRPCFLYFGIQLSLPLGH